jgi:DNA-binding transcriptional regulator YdaS (Cro superfamily)
MPLSSRDGLRIAIKTAGGLRAFARLLGITHQAIAQWDRVPAERVIEVERATGVPRGVLRPDLYLPGARPGARN